MTYSAAFLYCTKWTHTGFRFYRNVNKQKFIFGDAFNYCFA